MPRRRNPVPSYLHHKSTNRAYIILPPKRFVYLGEYGSAESKAKYAVIVADLQRGKPDLPPPVSALPRVKADGLTVAGLAEAFDGQLSGYSASETRYYRSALELLVVAAGDGLAADFGPRLLAEVREAMVAKGWTREHVNAQVRRVRSAFRWGESLELVPAGKWFQLRSLPGLKKGKTQAPEQTKKRTVSDDVVEATLPHLSPTVAAMVRFQRLTGCRPQDVCRLNAAEIDRTGVVWVFRPNRHKGDWRGLSREVYIGPQAQAVIAPRIAGREDAAAVFSPRAAWGERRAAMATGGRRNYRAKGPPLNVGEVYTTEGYNQAIERAAERAGVEHWTANRLRHQFATVVRKDHGLEAAQKLLGHRHATTTELYAAPVDQAAVEIIERIG